MGVFKNDVGRPSNKTILVRNILKGVAVVVVGTGLVAGGYFLNDYKKNENSNNENKINENESNNKENSEISNKIPDKYKDFEFVNQTEVEYNLYMQADATMHYSKVKVKNGSIVFELDNGKTLMAEGIDNVKYITTFNNNIHDIGSWLAALTTNGDLYFTSGMSSDGLTVYFEKIDYDKKIQEMFIAEEFNPDLGLDKQVSDLLYVLNEDGELLGVKENSASEKISYTISGKYEERKVLIGCTNGVCYIGEVNVADKTAKLYNGEEFSYIKYNNEIVKVKYIFDCWHTEEYSQRLYVVTQDNVILTPKTVIQGDNPYEFILHNKLKVKDVKMVKDDYSLDAVITYENGEMEIVKSSNMIYKEN